MSFKPNCLHNRIRHLFDTHFLFLTHYPNNTIINPLLKGKVRRTGENNGFDVIILSELPDEQFSEIIGVDELTKGFAGS